MVLNMISPLKMTRMHRRSRVNRMVTRLKSIQLMNVRGNKEHPSNVSPLYKVTYVLVCLFFSAVLHEIQERMDWLEEMEKLGEGHKYKPLIKTEIEERLRSIKKLQPHSNGDK